MRANPLILIGLIQFGRDERVLDELLETRRVVEMEIAALLDAYATAKRWSAEFARGARELANTLEQPVLDDAVRAQQSSGDAPAAPEESQNDAPTRFIREDESD